MTPRAISRAVTVTAAEAQAVTGPAEAPATFTAETATHYLRVHDAMVKRWWAMRAANRVALIERLAPQGYLFGGPSTWSRDEQVNHLAAEIFPRADEARAARYAQGA